MLKGRGFVSTIVMHTLERWHYISSSESDLLHHANIISLVSLGTISSTTMSSSIFQYIFDLADYLEQTGVGLDRYPIAAQSCNSADAAVQNLQDKTKEFKDYSDGSHKLINALTDLYDSFRRCQACITGDQPQGHAKLPVACPLRIHRQTTTSLWRSITAEVLPSSLKVEAYGIPLLHQW